MRFGKPGTGSRFLSAFPVFGFVLDAFGLRSNANKNCFCIRLIRIFDFVLDTSPRQNANKICFCARLIRIFVTFSKNWIFEHEKKLCVPLFLCLGIVLAVSMNLVGCSDDDGPVGTLYFPRDVCMVDKPGGTASVEFTAVNIVKLNITDTPEGWTVTADLQTSRMTVTAPASDDSDAETGGVLTLVGYDTDGKTVSADFEGRNRGGPSI